MLKGRIASCTLWLFCRPTHTPCSTSNGPVRRRSSWLGAGEHVLERHVTKSAELRPLGDVDAADTMQVVLSIKRATGIPVPDDR